MVDLGYFGNSPVLQARAKTKCFEPGRNKVFWAGLVQIRLGLKHLCFGRSGAGLKHFCSDRPCLWKVRFIGPDLGLKISSLQVSMRAIHFSKFRRSKISVSLLLSECILALATLVLLLGLLFNLDTMFSAKLQCVRHYIFNFTSDQYSYVLSITLNFKTCVFRVVSNASATEWPNQRREGIVFSIDTYIKNMSRGLFKYI